MILPAEWQTDPDNSPLDDLTTAIAGCDWTSPETFDVDAFPSTRIDAIAVADVKQVHQAYASYHGDKWTPAEKWTGTELELVALLELNDGRWASVNAWNDYTGWGCQDGADVRVGSRENVIRYGLDNAGRKLLGIELKGSDA